MALKWYSRCSYSKSPGMEWSCNDTPGIGNSSPDGSELWNGAPSTGMVLQLYSKYRNGGTQGTGMVLEWPSLVYSR